MTLTDRLAEALPINLDELERLLLCRIGENIWAEQNVRGGCYYRICDADTVLSLIARVRLADRLAEALRELSTTHAVGVIDDKCYAGALLAEYDRERVRDT